MSVFGSKSVKKKKGLIFMTNKFFEIGKPAPEKIHVTVTKKDDKEETFGTIASTVMASFNMIFETGELYKMDVDIRLIKNRGVNGNTGIVDEVVDKVALSDSDGNDGSVD
jgi:hypothetical protein